MILPVTNSRNTQQTKPPYPKGFSLPLLLRICILLFVMIPGAQTYAGSFTYLLPQSTCSTLNGNEWNVTFKVRHGIDSADLCPLGGMMNNSFRNGVTFEFYRDGVKEHTVIGYGTNPPPQTQQNLDFTYIIGGLDFTLHHTLVDYSAPAGKTHTWYVKVIYDYGDCGSASGTQPIVRQSDNVYITNPVVVPTAMPATDITCNSFRAHGVPTGFASRFYIDVATDINFTNILPAHHNKLMTGAVNPYYDVTGLLAGFSYYYRIRAENDCNTSLSSAPVSAMPYYLPAPLSPQVFQHYNCSSVEIDWADVAEATGYHVEVAMDPAFTSLINTGNTETTQSNITITGLTSSSILGPIYYYRIAATNSPTCLGGYTSGSFILERPVAPTGVTHTVQCNTAQLSFSTYYSSFRVVLSKDNFSTSYSVDFNNTAPPLQLTNLDPGTTYQYAVSNLGENGCDGMYSDNGSFTTDFVPAPVVPGFVPHTCKKFTAMWDAVPGVSYYSLEFSNNPGFSPSETKIINGVTYDEVSTFLGLELTPGTTYYYRVSASKIFPACSSVPSAVTTVALPAVVLQEAVIIPNTITCNAAMMQWQNNPDAADAIISIWRDQANPVYLEQDMAIPMPTQVYQINGLLPNTTYYYSFKAGTNPAECAEATFGSFTTLPPPDVPVLTGGDDITCKSFTANWDQVAGATGYYVDVFTDAGLGTPVTGYVNIYVSGGSTTELAITGLDPGQTYYYRVSSTSECVSAVSDATEVVTLDVTPINFTYQTTCNSATLNWNAIPNTVSYKLTVDGTTYTLPDNVLYFSFGSLTAATTFNYTLEAVTSPLDCSPTVTGTYTTKPILSAPVAANATLVDCYSFTANWNSVTGATSYYLDVATTSSFSSGTFVPGYQNLHLSVTSLNITGLVSGATYYYRVRSANECTSGQSNTISVQTRNTAPVASAGPDKATCGADPINLEGNTPPVGTGTWTVISGTGGSFANANNPTTVFTPTYGQVYELRWTISTACGNSYDDVKIYANTIPYTDANVAYRTELCTKRPICYKGFALIWDETKKRYHTITGYERILIPFSSSSGWASVDIPYVGDMPSLVAVTYDEQSFSNSPWDMNPLFVGYATHYVTTYPQELNSTVTGSVYSVMDPGNIDLDPTNDFVFRQHPTLSRCSQEFGPDWRLPTKTEVGINNSVANSQNIFINPAYSGYITSRILTSSATSLSNPSVWVVNFYGISGGINTYNAEVINVNDDFTDVSVYCVFSPSCTTSGNRTINEPIYNYGDVTSESDDLGLKGSAIKPKQITREVAAEIKVTFMPNPTSGDAVFNCSSGESFHYELIDMQGKTLQQGDLVSGDKINMEAYNTGIYMVRILTTQGTYITSTKLLKK